MFIKSIWGWWWCIETQGYKMKFGATLPAMRAGLDGIGTLEMLPNSTGLPIAYVRKEPIGLEVRRIFEFVPIAVRRPLERGFTFPASNGLDQIGSEGFPLGRRQGTVEAVIFRTIFRQNVCPLPNQGEDKFKSPDGRLSSGGNVPTIVELRLEVTLPPRSWNRRSCPALWPYGAMLSGNSISP